MIPFEKCVVCGGEMTEKTVETILRGGENTAVVEVVAEVCLKCGERMYSEDSVRMFENVRTKLERQQTEDFQLVGQSYRVCLQGKKVST